MTPTVRRLRPTSVGDMDRVPDRESTRLRRVVFYGQWFVALLTPILLFPGRTWLGAPAGWLAGFGLLMLAPPLFLALGAPVLVIASDPYAMRRRIVPRGYALANVFLWVALAVLVVSVSDPDDPSSSLAVIWTSGVVSPAMAWQVAVVAGIFAAGSWLVAVALAVGAWLEARRQRAD